MKLLENQGLIITEYTEIITKQDIKNDNQIYTILPMYEVTEHFYERQFHELELAVERQKAQSKLAE